MATLFPSKFEIVADRLKGKRVCFTGRFERTDRETGERITRPMAEQMVLQYGGTVIQNFKSAYEVDYLVVCDKVNPRSGKIGKMQRAGHDKNVLTANQFFKMIFLRPEHVDAWQAAIDEAGE